MRNACHRSFWSSHCLVPQTDQGKTQTVHTSLVQTTTAAQAAEFVDYANRPIPESGGFDYKGPDVNHQYVQENDQWFWIDDQGRTLLKQRIRGGATGNR